MKRYLTIGETAKRLGLEVDTVRKLERAGRIRAVRTRGGHRRFGEEEIERFRKARRNSSDAKKKTAKPRRRTQHKATVRTASTRHPKTGEFVSADIAFADDLEEFEEEIPFDEFDDDFPKEVHVPPSVQAPSHMPRVPQAPSPRPVLFEARSAPVPRPPVADSESVHQFRLQLIKNEGRAAIPHNLPAVWQGRVIAELERYVTPIQFPADLSYVKAREIVRAHVADVLRPYREAEEEARQEKKAKEEADRRRSVLIAHGNNYAWRETNDWDWSASHEARSEVKQVLEREVKHNWTEHEVEEVVDQLLDEWDDDDDEEWDDD